ncbi:MAG: complex I subunit 4 family protein [Candidatus Cyclobacteriaceae bacterium M3_2C_046]
MILIWFIIILMGAGSLAWITGRKNPGLARALSLAAVLLNLAIITYFWLTHISRISISQEGAWLINYQQEWISRFGISFHFALDGLSLLMLILTFFLGAVAILTSWTQVTEKVGFFHFNLLWILAGITGVFTSLDLFLFYCFWEIMLIPMYFIIGIWGYEKRIYAAYKFFIFTQASGLLMFLAILSLYFIQAAQTGLYSFDYAILSASQIPAHLELWLMGGFAIAFLVKLPAFPFHNWLPDAHTQAPTAGSVILAGLLLKTGAYGLLRFVVPFFPQAVQAFAPYAMLLGVIGILYGAMLAFSQTDLKRLVAYTSVSHMGFIVLGVFALNELAFQGVVLQMITHGISTGALFILVGLLQERMHTRDINEIGGLWREAPKMGVVGLVFAMASLGLPGLGNFIAEFLILVGSFQADKVFTIIATIGLIASAVYSLRFYQKVFQGQKKSHWSFNDLNIREMVVLGTLVISIIWLGLYPQPVINTARSSLKFLLNGSHQKVIHKRSPKEMAKNKKYLYRINYDHNRKGAIP